MNHIVIYTVKHVFFRFLEDKDKARRKKKKKASTPEESSITSQPVDDNLLPTENNEDETEVSGELMLCVIVFITIVILSVNLHVNHKRELQRKSRFQIFHGNGIFGR